MHHHRIVDVELHTVVDIVECVVEIDHGLCRELRRQPHVAPLDKGILRLFQKVITEHAECVEMKFGVGIGFGEIGRMFRTTEMVVVVAVE